MCVHVHVCLCIYVSVHIFVYVCMDLHVHVCMWCICICLRAHECGDQEKDFGHHFLSKIHLSLLNFYGGWVVRQPVAHFVG